MNQDGTPDVLVGITAVLAATTLLPAVLALLGSRTAGALPYPGRVTKCAFHGPCRTANNFIPR